MHGSIFVLGENEGMPDKSLLVRFLDEARSFYSGSFDSVGFMDEGRKREESACFLDYAETYLQRDDTMIFFTIRQIVNHDCRLYGYPEWGCDVFLNYNCFLEWTRQHWTFLKPVILLDGYGISSFGYSLLDCVLYPFRQEIRNGIYPDMDRRYSYYLLDVFSYEY